MAVTPKETAKAEAVAKYPKLAEFDVAQAGEYGAYVASEVIWLDGARAFNPGDAVPVSHVDRGIVSRDQVRLRAEMQAAGESVPVVPNLPVGATVAPDPDDVRFAEEANRAAGVTD